jgi:hypothetical protein
LPVSAYDSHWAVRRVSAIRGAKVTDGDPCEGCIHIPVLGKDERPVLARLVEAFSHRMRNGGRILSSVIDPTYQASYLPYNSATIRVG